MPEFTLAGAIKAADELSTNLSFPKINKVFDYQKNKNISSQYIEPRGCLIEAIRRQGKKVVIKYIPASEADGAFPDLTVSITRKDRNGVYCISIDQRCSFCARRFAGVKELLHVYFDILERSPAIQEITDTLSDAINSRRVIGEKGQDDNDIVLSGEAFCYIVAIEILLPFGEYRSHVENEHDPGNGKNDYYTALMTRIPSSVIYFYFSKFRAFSSRLHGEGF